MEAPPGNNLKKYPDFGEKPGVGRGQSTHWKKKYEQEDKGGMQEA